MGSRLAPSTRAACGWNDEDGDEDVRRGCGDASGGSTGRRVLIKHHSRGRIGQHAGLGTVATEVAVAAELSGAVSTGGVS
jgi:hypothetical protein